MNSFVISLLVGAVCAGLLYQYNQSKKHIQGFEPVNIAYTAGGMVLLTYCILYAMRDEKAEVLNEIEVGEPDF